MNRFVTLAIALTAVLSTGCLAAPKVQGRSASWQPAPKSKPLSDHVKMGLAWLAKTQHDNGGWSQGEESTHMGSAMDPIKDKPNTADTCAATLALIRAGSTPGKGPYAKNVRAGVNFVCAQIEESDAKSLYVTDVRGTRLQMKLGTYIDTFLSSLLLAEVKGQMPDRKSETRVGRALNKAIGKIEANQRPDGTWNDQGWAPALEQSMATKAINRAAQKGQKVDEEVREKAETHARAQYNAKEGKFSSAGTAGVALYGAAAPVASMQDSDNSNIQLERQTKAQLKGAKTESERKAAQKTLERIQGNRADLAEARSAVVKKLDDQQFISGFGSNGGEEFLSYMNIGESLVVKGGPDWKKWDREITQNLNRIQNNDGSWTGHHCITGRTFCTAAAILVLTTDRAPVPLGGEIKRR